MTQTFKVTYFSDQTLLNFVNFNLSHTTPKLMFINPLHTWQTIVCCITGTCLCMFNKFFGIKVLNDARYRENCPFSSKGAKTKYCLMIGDLCGRVAKILRFYEHLRSFNTTKRIQISHNAFFSQCINIQ